MTSIITCYSFHKKKESKIRVWTNLICPLWASQILSLSHSSFHPLSSLHMHCFIFLLHNHNPLFFSLISLLSLLFFDIDGSVLINSIFPIEFCSILYYKKHNWWLLRSRVPKDKHGMQICIIQLLFSSLPWILLIFWSLVCVQVLHHRITKRRRNRGRRHDLPSP